MNKLVFHLLSLSERRAMIEENDRTGIFLIRVIELFTLLLILFASFDLFYRKDALHISIVVSIGIIAIFSLILINYRVTAMIKFDNAVDEHCNKILQDYNAAKASIDDFVNAYFDSLKLNSKMEKLIIDRIEKHVEKIAKHKKDQIEIQANLKKINEW